MSEKMTEPPAARQSGWSPQATARRRAGRTSPGRVCHFKSAVIHLNVLNNSYDRMYL
jgi:hypothetical protein